MEENLWDHDFDFLFKLVASRRSNLNIDKTQVVDRDRLLKLCELIQWAPNHKRSWPWTIAVFENDSRGTLGDCIADAMLKSGVDIERAEKARLKYFRAPTILIVGSILGLSELEDRENRDAVASGIQNMLIGATAYKMASFWSTCDTVATESVVELCEFPKGTSIVGILYLGWPLREVPIPQRPSLSLKFMSQKP